MERLLPDLGRRVPALRPHRDDGAAADVQRDLGEADVRQLHLLALAFDDLVRVEVVKAVVGKVDGDARLVLLRHRRDEEGIAEEELQVVAEGVRVVRVEKEEWVQRGRAVDALLLRGRVEVVKEAVPDVEGAACGVCDGVPQEELLCCGNVSSNDSRKVG